MKVGGRNAAIASMSKHVQMNTKAQQQQKYQKGGKQESQNIMVDTQKITNPEALFELGGNPGNQIVDVRESKDVNDGGVPSQVA